MPDLSDPTSWIAFVAVGLVILLLGVIVFSFSRRSRDSVNNGRNKKQKGKGAAASGRRDTARIKRLDEEKMREIYKDLAEMTATLNYQRVLDIALDLSMQALAEADTTTNRLVSAVLLFTQPNSQKPVLYIGAARRLTRTDMSATFPAEKGLLREAIDEGAALLAYEISQDPELGQTIAIHQCKVGYCIPLRTGINVCVVMLFANPNTNFFSIANR